MIRRVLRWLLMLDPWHRPRPVPSFSELVLETLRKHPAAIADNVVQNNALYRRMRNPLDGARRWNNS